MALSKRQEQVARIWNEIVSARLETTTVTWIRRLMAETRDIEFVMTVSQLPEYLINLIVHNTSIKGAPIIFPKKPHQIVGPIETDYVEKSLKDLLDELKAEDNPETGPEGYDR